MGTRFTGPRQGLPQLPPVKYFEANGNLREALVDSEAETVADLLAAERLNTTQIRAYYFEVLTLRRRIDLELANAADSEAEAIFLRYRPELKMLRAKVHYAHARKTIRDTMKQFLEGHIKAVQTLKEFRAFCAHFEAVVAFHKGKSGN
jgi:CRISPR type III-A-associated protein Csm2